MLVCRSDRVLEPMTLAEQYNASLNASLIQFTFRPHVPDYFIHFRGSGRFISPPTRRVAAGGAGAAGAVPSPIAKPVAFRRTSNVEWRCEHRDPRHTRAAGRVVETNPGDGHFDAQTKGRVGAARRGRRPVVQGAIRVSFLHITASSAQHLFRITITCVSWDLEFSSRRIHFRFISDHIFACFPY